MDSESFFCSLCARLSFRACLHPRHLLASIGFAGPGAVVFPFVEADLKRAAAQVLENVKCVCAAKRVPDVACEVVEGDARSVLCEAVDKHQASLFVVGSHGYGALKRAVLGSVSD